MVLIIFSFLNLSEICTLDIIGHLFEDGGSIRQNCLFEMFLKDD